MSRTRGLTQHELTAQLLRITDELSTYLPILTARFARRRLTDQGQADVVVTMSRGDECPIYPGKRYHD